MGSAKGGPIQRRSVGQTVRIIKAVVDRERMPPNTGNIGPEVREALFLNLFRGKSCKTEEKKKKGPRCSTMSFLFRSQERSRGNKF